VLPEELFCCLVGGIQACSIASGSAPTAVLIGQLVPNPLGKTLYSLLKTQVIDLLQKAVSISALATPKAVIKPITAEPTKSKSLSKAVKTPLIANTRTPIRFSA